MGQLSVTIVASLLLFLTYYLLVVSVMVKASAIPSGSPSSSSSSSLSSSSSVQNGNSLLENNRNRKLIRPLVYTRSARSPFSNTVSAGRIGTHQKVPIEMELLFDDDDFYDKSKRYDDYGHMRFGKRGGEDQFDDYGHMRFGKRAD